MSYPEENINGYDVIISNVYPDIFEGTTETMRIIAPSGIKKGFSGKVGDPLIMNGQVRATFRSFATKIPVFYFSGFSVIDAMSTLIMSDQQFMTLVSQTLWPVDEEGN